MIRYRLINCNFVNEDTFMKLSTKARVLYMTLMSNGDDMGIVGNCDILIKTLARYDEDYEQARMLGLEETIYNEFINSKLELLNKSYIYIFQDKLGNEIIVIKHWFLHNRWREGLTTTYPNILEKLDLFKGEWFLKGKKKSSTKEKEIKLKENKGNKLNNRQKISDEEWEKTLRELEEVEVKADNEKE